MTDPYGHPQQASPQGVPPQNYPQQQGYPPQNYPQQQGYPQQGYPQQPAGFPPPNPYAVNPPKKKGKTKVVIFSIIAVLAVAFVAWALVEDRQTNPDYAKVGSCIAPNGGDDVKVVKCTDATAKWTVAGSVKIDHTPSRTDFEAKCEPWTNTTDAFFKGDSNGSGGYILCLAAKS